MSSFPSLLLTSLKPNMWKGPEVGTLHFDTLTQPVLHI